MKFGVICSAGGGTFFSAFDLLMQAGIKKDNEFYLISDRSCLAEKEADSRGVCYTRIEDKKNSSFSQKACKWFKQQECDVILLFFSRLVTKELFSEITTLNIHPSLLPAYKGFHALDKAISDHVSFIGATLHLVIEKVDSGPIISQVLSPVQHHFVLENFSKLSYVQKVYLTLLAIDLMQYRFLSVNLGLRQLKWDRETRHTWTSNPALNDKRLIEVFNNFQKKQNFEVLIP